MNMVILIGHLGSDPEAKTTQNGTSMCTFSMATEEKFQGKTNVEWHNITVFGVVADRCVEYLTKGSQVCVVGSLRTFSWVAKDGSKRKSTGVTARTVQFLGKNRTGFPVPTAPITQEGEDDVPI